MKKTVGRVIAALLAAVLLFALGFFLLPLTETVRRVPVRGSAAYGHPWKYAKALNEKLEALRRSDLNGWIVVDFATPQLAQKIYEANY